MSPLRHWTGSIPNKPVAWHCPSCTAENTGPLERGCTSCHAGDPAYAKVAQQTETYNESKLQHVDLSGLRARVKAYVDWRDRNREHIPIVLDDALQFAFEAGADWARTEGAAPAGNALHEGVGGNERTEAAQPTGGWMVALIAPRTFAEDELIQLPTPVGPRAQITILAALAFYKDNQLGYGDIPGQLTATECSQLIAQLQEQEPPV